MACARNSTTYVTSSIEWERDMDEIELAQTIQDFIFDQVSSEMADAESDGYTAFLVWVDGKRFKIMVQEGGE